MISNITEHGSVLFQGHPQYDPNEEGDREIPILRTRHDHNTGFSPNAPRQQVILIQLP